jgi:glycosyltransferase involved in cell wall biosynthesis
MPHASIVVRTKNRPELLARALDDILSQTLADWELVIVNDGGTPDAVDAVVAERSDALAGRVRVLHNEQSRGMESAANQGVAATSAPFIAIHDDDDTWDADFLRATVSALTAAPDAVAVAVNTEIVIERLSADGPAIELERHPYPAPMGIVTLYDLLITNRVVPISLLVRRSALDVVGGYDERLPVVGDWEMNLRLATEGDILYLDGPVRAFWRQRPDSSGASSNSIFAGAALHDRYDRLVRDRALRERARTQGIGDVLYLSRHIQDVAGGVARSTADELRQAIGESERRVLAETHRRLDELESRLLEAVRYHSPAATVRRNLRRILRPGARG